MRGRIIKLPNFPALQNQFRNEQADTQSELILPQSLAATSALHQVLPSANGTTQNKRSSDRKRRSPSYYFKNSSSDSAKIAPPKRPRRSGDIESYQPTNVSVVETVQTTADQLPVEDNISPVTGDV